MILSTLFPITVLFTISDVWLIRQSYGFSSNELALPLVHFYFFPLASIDKFSWIPDKLMANLGGWVYNSTAWVRTLQTVIDFSKHHIERIMLSAHFLVYQ